MRYILNDRINEREKTMLTTRTRILRICATALLLLLWTTAASAANLLVSWNASATPGVIGYRVHYGTASGTYTTQLDVGNVLTTTLTTLTVGQTYFLAAVAYDAALSSVYSNEISYTVPPEGTAGLVAAYGFDTGSGATVTDSSGTNHGTIAGAVWTASGKFGQALVFDGVDDVVTIPDAAALDLTTGMTMEAWVYPTASQAGWKSILQKDPGAYFMYGHAEAPLVPAVGGILVGGQVLAIYGTSAMALNTWTHLAATYNGTTLNFYVNGVLVSSVAASGALDSTTGPLRLGAGATAGEVFAGRIDEVRLYNRALTVTEIQTDMATPVTPATPPPPVANFTGTPLSGTVPLAVPFTNTTTGNATSWAWTFGDGGTSTAQHPSRTYTAAGTYTVVLTATGPGGSHTLTRAAYIVGTAPASPPAPPTQFRVGP